MNDEKIALFAAKLSAFRATLSADEQDILDGRFARKSGDDVEAHAMRARFAAFDLEGDEYRVARVGKAGDDDDVAAHARM